MSDTTERTAGVTAVKEAPAVRVARGAVRLDEREPDWFRLVDLSELDLSSTAWCVITQVLDDYHTGIASLGLHGTHGDDPNPGMSDAAHGFDIFYDGTESEETFRRLEDAWRSEVKMRRTGERAG